MRNLNLHIIAAIDQQSGLGKNNQLLWHLPEDLKFFKQTTQGHPVIMGRKTHESIGFALPGRLNIVVSGQDDLSFKGCVKVSSLREALGIAKRSLDAEASLNDVPVNTNIENKENKADVFIIGGAQIYMEAMATLDISALWITHVEATFAADVFFPTINENVWQAQKIKDGHDSPSGLNFKMIKYTKI